jgi:hypothetical protein
MASHLKKISSYPARFGSLTTLQIELARLHRQELAPENTIPDISNTPASPSTISNVCSSEEGLYK